MEENGQEQCPNQQFLTVDCVRQALENQIVDTIKAAVSNDELSRSTESDSGFDSASCSGTVVGGFSSAAVNVAATAANSGNNKLPTEPKMTTTENENGNNNDKQLTTTANKVKQYQKTPTNTLICLPHEENKQDDPTMSLLSLPKSTAMSEPEAMVIDEASATATSSSRPPASPSSSTLKRLCKQLQRKTAAEAATDDVNMWANKFLRDLDNLIASDKPATSSSDLSSPTTNVYCSSPSSATTTSPMLLSAAASAVIQSRYGKTSHDRSPSHGSGGTSYDHNAVSEPISAPTATNANTPNGIVLRPEKHVSDFFTFLYDFSFFTKPFSSCSLGMCFRCASS